MEINYINICFECQNLILSEWIKLPNNIYSRYKIYLRFKTHEISVLLSVCVYVYAYIVNGMEHIETKKG